MTDQLLGELRIMGFGIQPRGWMACNGQLLPLRQYTALFSLLGTAYGGDGVNTFGLPDLRGRTPIGVGGASPLGAPGGGETVTLVTDQLPMHNHMLFSDSTTAYDGNVQQPAGAAFGQTKGMANPGGPFDLSLYAAASPSVQLASAAVANAGNSAPHENRQPFIAMNICIAYEGLYPSRP